MLLIVRGGRTGVGGGIQRSKRRCPTVVVFEVLVGLSWVGLSCGFRISEEEERKEDGGSGRGCYNSREDGKG